MPTIPDWQFVGFQRIKILQSASSRQAVIIWMQMRSIFLVSSKEIWLLASSLTDIESGYLGRTIANPKFDWTFFTVPQKHAGGQPILVPRGKGLGGSSAVRPTLNHQ